MKLWQAQQILCRYQPDVEVHVKIPDGRVVLLDHLEDHLVKPTGCSCSLDRRDPEWDEQCPEHGEPHPANWQREPLFVTAESHSPEVFHQAEEAVLAHRVLDDLGVPREEENPREEGEMATLSSRIQVALEKARGESPEYEYETTSQACGQVGVDKAKVPNPPPTSGWELVSAACAGNSFWYWWRRPKRAR